MTNQTTITYDPKGTGENYGIQFYGDIRKLFKYLQILIQRNVTFPTTSHHGTTIKIKDFPFNVCYAHHEWTHGNKGNGMTKLKLIFSAEQWVYSVDVHGNVIHRQRGISADEKKGLMKMLERMGYTIIDKWNENGHTPSLSVIVDYDVNMIQNYVKGEWEELFITFTKELSDLSDTSNELQKIS